MTEFEGRAALVTGASRGIGRAVAIRLAAGGARVAAAARDAAALEALSAAAPAGAVLPLPLDLSRPEGPGDAVARAVAAFGGLDILVNNAGATRRGDFLTLSEADWALGWDLKFFGAVRATRAAWPHLVARRGAVVTIGGVGGRVASAEFTVGGPVNAALMNLTKALADRGVADGVRVNLVNPGSVATDRLAGRINAKAQEAGVDAAKAAHLLAKETGVSRFGTPEEIAEAVAFLAGPRAAYVQGALLDVDGGWVRAV
jgi:3-oxoacyl-[acyl-carrier protein] reductase